MIFRLKTKESNSWQNKNLSIIIVLMEKEQLAKIAQEVIDELGGNKKAAVKINALIENDAEKISEYRVQKWRYNGIAPKMCQYVSQLSGRRPVDLRPDYKFFCQEQS